MQRFRMIAFGVIAALAVAACTTDTPAERRTTAGSGGESPGSGGGSGIGIGSGGMAGVPLPPPIRTDAAAAGAGGAGMGNLQGTITSDTPSPVTVSGQPVPVRFTLLIDGLPSSRATWSVDDTRIGSIGADGVFQANGQIGGEVTVTATLGTNTFTTKITVNVDITDNPAGLSPADQAALKAGGAPGDTTFRWLYPYDRTVFPRGLSAPALQFGGTAANAIYLTIKLPFYNYQLFAAGGTPVRATIPEIIWRGVTLTARAADPMQVSLTKRSGTEVTGPVSESWFIAPATLKGIVYYNTYKSPLAANGGIMRIRAGQPGQGAEVVQSGCTVCHSVSANGSVLAASLNYSVPELNPIDSATYDLSPTGTVTIRAQSTEGRLFSFAALTPDGTRALVNGLPPNRWPPFIARGIFAPQGLPSRLVDTKTGLDIAAPSLAALSVYAQTPAFSPDGKRVAFVNGDRLERRVLSVLDYDGAAAPPAFSNLRDIIDQTKALAWPTFLPDGDGIVYHEGDSFDSYIFSENNAPSRPQFAEIRLVTVADKKVKPLYALNGRTAAGVSYLPYGEAVEGQMNYEPSALPVAVGGYYWVLFTSRRTYGNTIAPGGTLPRGADPWGNESDPSPRKKIWIAAIDIDHPLKDDPSHPGFYLSGQEVEAGNMRAFAALAPCKSDGSSCESGADCCNGFCRETGRAPDGTPILQCVPPPPNTCSNTDELCTTAADCCDPKELCINNRCTARTVIK